MKDDTEKQIGDGIVVEVMANNDGEYGLFSQPVEGKRVPHTFSDEEVGGLLKLAESPALKERLIVRSKDRRIYGFPRSSMTDEGAWPTKALAPPSDEEVAAIGYLGACVTRLACDPRTSWALNTRGEMYYDFGAPVRVSTSQFEAIELVIALATKQAYMARRSDEGGLAIIPRWARFFSPLELETSGTVSKVFESLEKDAFVEAASLAFLGVRMANARPVSGISAREIALVDAMTGVATSVPEDMAELEGLLVRAGEGAPEPLVADDLLYRSITLAVEGRCRIKPHRDEEGRVFLPKNCPAFLLLEATRVAFLVAEQHALGIATSGALVYIDAAMDNAPLAPVFLTEAKVDEIRAMLAANHPLVAMDVDAQGWPTLRRIGKTEVDLLDEVSEAFHAVAAMICGHEAPVAYTSRPISE